MALLSDTDFGFMKNKHGGSKARKQKRNADEMERKLVLADKDKGEDYGIITKLLGHCRVKVKISKNEKEDRLGIICGQMKCFQRYRKAIRFGMKHHKAKLSQPRQ